MISQELAQRLFEKGLKLETEKNIGIGNDGKKEVK
jgi:hypothetical protein